MSSVEYKTALASSGLPECSGVWRSTWTNCFGIHTRARGDKYVGEYRDGDRHGQGTEIFPNGNKYVGEFRDDKIHGQEGTYTYGPSSEWAGDKYVGESRDNKWHGQGTYTFADGRKYVGEYRDGKWHGQGTYTFADGGKYVGEWTDNDRHGQGTETFADGGKYVGEWRDNKRHGQGTLFHAYGRVEEGIWSNGEFQYAKKGISSVTASKNAPPSPSSADFQKGLTAAQSNDFVTALREWTPLAEQGDARAQSNLGSMYHQGYGVQTDFRTALKWYTLAAEQGVAYAQKQLGFLYDSGWMYPGVPHDEKTARKWYTLAAEQGDARAQFLLGQLYEDGDGVPQNDKTALKWYTLAKEQGDTLASTYFASGAYFGEFRDGKIHGQGIFTARPNATAPIRYVGEFRNDNFNGQGILTHLQGEFSTVEEGIFKNGAFQYAKKGTPTVSSTITASKTPSAAEIEVQNLRKEVARLKEIENEKLRKEVARLKEQQKQQSKEVAEKNAEPEPKSLKSSKPSVFQFKKVPERPDDVAVIIANSNYKKQGRDIPNVDPAYNDAENIKQYFMEAKGVREGNIIYLKDATGAQLTSVFGNITNHKANLFNWVKPDKSNVYVYYVGHGAPASKDGSAFLVPVDATSQTIEFSGYPLNNLYRNLGKIKARSITVILEACFSGVSQAGALLPRSSGITIVAKAPKVPANVKVISAGSADQMASWEKDESQSLFTKYFLRAMSGAGDKNKDGKVDDAELKTYLEGTMTYFARRYYGRDQKVTIASGW